MKVDYSNFLSKLAGMVSITGIGLLLSLPAGAKDALNSTSSIFNEALHNHSSRIVANAGYTPSESAAVATTKTPNKNLVVKKVAQAQGGTLNPSPSIFNEPPYSRGSRTAPSETSPTQPTTPETTPSETAPSTGTSEAGGNNVVALAESNSEFKTLAKALQAAGLTDTLKGPGPFTIFAPTDAAFAELPQDALQDLMKPENREVLVKILTYHVVPGQVLSTDLKSGEVKTVEGGPINVKVDQSAGVMVNDAKVLQPDVKASNGVIHKIDKVMLPPDL